VPQCHGAAIGPDLRSVKSEPTSLTTMAAVVWWLQGLAHWQIAG
jgi:hypothetical protein